MKNKKSQSIEYEKKRKLTKLNKDTNLGNGKVWTNRMKEIILPKVLPKNQYNCQKDINIISEIVALRDINHELLEGNDGKEKDGTILSIDFSNAFRSTSLRWFNLVMKQLNIPEEFINWFWAMYNNLKVKIKINEGLSNSIKIEKGFMEGHPPSMAAFVTQIIPLFSALEKVLDGIKIRNQTERLKGFADNVKVIIRRPEEIGLCYKIISRFEEISGLRMHRDPLREKCQALPFGSHREYKHWPVWVTVKNRIKIVGIWFTNERNKLEEVNTTLVEQNFYMTLNEASGMRGTLQQKVHYVNTYLFSKLWYVAQVFKMDNKKMTNLLKAALNFIYSGENERPVRSLNFREKERGGLGLVDPEIKAKALLGRNMYQQWLQDKRKVEDIYGDTNILERLIIINEEDITTKQIYKILIKERIEKNGSLIQSRNEKRQVGIRWRHVWKNLRNTNGINAAEKDFAWKLTQDMLPIGKRIHRINVEKRCLNKIREGLCEEVPDIMHKLYNCQSVVFSARATKLVLEEFMDKKIEDRELLTLSFRHRTNEINQVAVWFAIRALFEIFNGLGFNKAQMFTKLYKELDWNIGMGKKIGSFPEMARM